jgi:hypothetical protein
MILALAAQFCWVVIYYRERSIAHTASGVMVFVLFLPWILFLPWVQRFFQGVTKYGLASEAPAGSTAAFRGGFSWESIPYTFFAYSSGFSFGPTVAEMHESRSLGFILQFGSEILLVGVVFGALLLVGLPALYKFSGAKTTTFCVLGLSIPIFGTLLYASAPRAAYNVRYTIAAFPYFCILVAVGLTMLFEKRRALGVVFSLGAVVIASTSLANHFFNPRYAKEDIRSAVAFWRSDSKAEPLLSVRSHYVLSAYLRESEKERHAPLGGDVVSDVNRTFSKTGAPSIYILLARDWRKLREKAVRQAYGVDYEQSYPGVKILRISNPQMAGNHKGAS